jgi:hypothetical protein
MAPASSPTFEQTMDRLLTAAHACGAWLRFRTVRGPACPEMGDRQAPGDLARDELILTLPNGCRERFDLGADGIDRLVEAGVLRRCSPESR